MIRRRYDSYKDNDLEIIERVHDLADKYHVSMTQISLAWLYHKGVTAPIVGATKIPHFDDAVKAMDLTISDEDCQYLEELYLPHAINGNK